MSTVLPASEALYRLLAIAWDPRAAPEPGCVPWEEVLDLVGHGNLSGLLHTLAADLRADMPPAVHQTLQAAHYAAIAANVRTLDQLEVVRAALEPVGAPLLLLKGAALTEDLYADLGPRLIGDIDLVTPKEVIPACRAALLALGYTLDKVEARAGSQSAWRSQEMLRPPSATLTPVELHWHVLDVPYYMYRLPMDWFWEHSASRVIGEQSYRVLDDVANMVYLPAHLALHHAFTGLHALYDLALLIARRQERLDWGSVIAAARTFELVSALRETLDRLAQCWPELPLDEPRRLLAEVTPSRSDARLYRLLTTHVHNTPLNIYTMLTSLPTTGARARYLWDNVFPQPAYMRARYPVRRGWHLPWWYAWRALGGLLRFARALPRLVRQARSRD